MKKFASLLLIVGAVTLMAQAASAKSRVQPTLPPPDPNPEPLVSAQ